MITCKGCRHSQKEPGWQDLNGSQLVSCSIEAVAGKIPENEERDCASYEADVVFVPAHYVPTDGVEFIDYLRQVLSPEEFIGFARGNALKYQHRARLKGSMEADLRKSANYALLAAGYDFRTDLAKKS
jgi:hypothetical protein